MVVILDNGHGDNTPGKRSPNGLFFEWQFTRQLAKRIADKLKADGKHKGILLVTENTDIPLNSRARRANRIASEHKAKGEQVILLSIHNNAAGDGSSWATARGFSSWIAPNASANSKRLAQILTRLSAQQDTLIGNRCIPKEKYWVGNFAIVRDTTCPAVLTENLFMDNKADLALLQDPATLDTLADLHIQAINQYAQQS